MKHCLVHKRYFKERIYRKYKKILFKLKRNLDFTQSLNEWQLGYKVYHLKRKRKYGTPLLKENNNTQKKNKNDKNK
jgi:hypothetical protein